MRWLAWFVAKRAVSLALAGACVLVDLVIPWHGAGFTLRGVFDEPCHLVTALVILGAITRIRGTAPDPKFGWSMLACSVLIDVDHLPLEFGSPAVTAGTPRPYTHALWVVAVVIAAAVAARHRPRKSPGKSAASSLVLVLAGAAWGVSAHFLRDVATAPIALWWPVTSAAVQVPYWWFVLALAIFVATPPRPANVTRPAAA